MDWFFFREVNDCHDDFSRLRESVLLRDYTFDSSSALSWFITSSAALQCGWMTSRRLPWKQDFKTRVGSSRVWQKSSSANPFHVEVIVLVGFAFELEKSVKFFLLFHWTHSICSLCGSCVSKTDYRHITSPFSNLKVELNATWWPTMLLWLRMAVSTNNSNSVDYGVCLNRENCISRGHANLHRHLVLDLRRLFIRTPADFSCDIVHFKNVLLCTTLKA